jgi:hypothetical protein
MIGKGSFQLPKSLKTKEGIEMLRIYRQEGQEIKVRYGNEPHQELMIRLCNLDFHRNQAQIGVTAGPEVLIMRAEKPRTQEDREQNAYEHARS